MEFMSVDLSETNFRNVSCRLSSEIIYILCPPSADVKTICNLVFPRFFPSMKFNSLFESVSARYPLGRLRCALKFVLLAQSDGK